VAPRAGSLADLVSSRVLVTGAYGLLGVWLAKALVAAGADVVALRYGRREPSVLGLFGLEDAVTVVDGDICTPGFVRRQLAEHRVDSVFHLAAQTLVGVAMREPAATFEVNVRGTWMVLEACRQCGVERVLVASSDKAYGRHEELPYRESHELRGLYPYDASKAACDVLARSYWHSFGLPVAVTRFANLYGGGDLHGSRLVPESVCAVLAGRAPVLRSDGSPERDFLYVEDAAAAYLAIWQAMDSAGAGARGEAFNAGGERPVRVRDVVTLICELHGAGIAPEIQGSGTPEGEIDRQWVDAGKLRALTGWRPKVALPDGLARTLAWYREHPDARRAVTS
jgi:CDP-glucose 4,6-dehydratase